MNELMIGWTTVEDSAAAQRIADGLVQKKLAACAQIAGPITSHYVWQGKAQTSSEYTVTLKFLESNFDAIQDWFVTQHPYDTPEWCAVRVDKVSPQYLAWAQEMATPRQN